LPTLIYLGLRGRELERLQWRDLLLDAPQPAVHVRGEKSDAADRLVDVPPPLIPILTRWRDQHPDAKPTDFVFGSRRKPGSEMTSWIKPTRRACQLAGVPYYGPAQCFRRTCITHSALLRNGEQLSEQQLKQFGHADVAVTRAHYIKQLSGSEPPHSRGEHLDFAIEHYLKVSGVAERKATVAAYSAGAKLATVHRRTCP
jgi:integrase